MKLLSKGTTNAKTTKNELTSFIFYGAPSTQNSKSIDMCPKASDGCRAACLFSAGRGSFANVINARVNKTEYYLSDRSGFVNQLAKEILSKVTYYKRKGERIAFRLNGTTDVDFVYQLKKYAGLDIADLKEDAIFYDYTAILGKAIKYKNHPNYVVTYSRKETQRSHSEALQALSLGINIAAVFETLPESYEGFKVVDGDKSDLVMLEHKGVILGLKAKGAARKDKSGFVIRETVFA